MSSRSICRVLRNEFEEALWTYTKAAALSSAQLKLFRGRASEEAYNYDASIWLNRSICNRKLENWEDAATDAEIAQEIDPSNVKAAWLLERHVHRRRLTTTELWPCSSEVAPTRPLRFHVAESLQALKICKKGLQVQENKA